MLLTNCANILAISLRKVKKIRRYLLSICAAVNKRRALLPKMGALQVVKTKTCLWYFCGQMRNRRGKNHGDFQFWWTVRGSNPRPRRCERRALPNATQHGPHSFGQARLFASFTWARVLRGILRGCEPLGGSLRMIRILAPNE